MEAIAYKAKKTKDFQPLTKIIFTNCKYNLRVIYAIHPTYKKYVKSNGKHSQIDSVAFKKMPIFKKNISGLKKEYVQLYGRVNNQRELYWVKEAYIVDSGNLYKYKVFVPSSNGSGALGEVLSTPVIGTPRVGCTQTFLGVGAFDTQTEAESCMKYLKSKFARALLGVLKITQHNPPVVWEYIPLQDFTSSSDIDWSKPVPKIDRQLYQKYGLDEKEIDFIETHVKEMA